MERSPLNDKDVYPDDEVLAKHLGRTKAAWDAFTAAVAERYADASLEWRYYNDGKAWLCKFTRKKKTVAWVTVRDRCFTATCYFTAKNEKDIEALPIAPDLKEAFRAHPGFGKLKPLTIEVKNLKALGEVFAVAEYKMGVK